MGFLELAKQARGAVSVQSDQSSSDGLVSSLTALSSHYTPGDGCSLHGVSSSDVAVRWSQLEAISGQTREDDHGAQWSVVGVCPCCCGPSRVETLLCTPCEVADSTAPRPDGNRG